MKATKLTPFLSERIWGGDRLTRYGKDAAAGGIGESWELSFIDGCESTVAGTPVSEHFPRSTWGTRAQRFERFPVLTKFIDAKDNLSVQVHPDDTYALREEGSYGKTEMWIVLEAEEGAGLYLGFRETMTSEDVRRYAEDGTLENYLDFRPVTAGDVFFIPAGTVHAIGRGVLLYEIQQSSDLTYRLYDYHRRDAAGRLRELHVDRALRVSELCPYDPPKVAGDDPSVVGECSYFTTRICKLNCANKTFFVDETSFLMLTVMDGEGEIDGQRAVKGDTFFIPAAAGEITASGTVTLAAVSLG